MSDILYSGRVDLEGLAARIKVEQEKQAKIESPFPAGYAALTSSERLKAVSVAYQDNPGLRREILEFIELDLRRTDQSRAVSPEEMQRQMQKNADWAEREMERQQAQSERRYQQILQQPPVPAKRITLDEIAKTKDAAYKRSTRGLMDVMKAKVGEYNWIDPDDQGIIRGADKAAVGGEWTTIEFRNGVAVARDPAGKFTKTKAAPKPQVPMAPQAGRRKIRLDD